MNNNNNERNYHFFFFIKNTSRLKFLGMANEDISDNRHQMACPMQSYLYLRPFCVTSNLFLCHSEHLDHERISGTKPGQTKWGKCNNIWSFICQGKSISDIDFKRVKTRDIESSRAVMSQLRFSWGNLSCQILVMGCY